VVTAADLDTLGEVLRLEDRREFDRARFENWSRASSALVRRHAATGAGRIGQHSAAPMLLRLLVDSDSAVRADAAFALGELGDSSNTVVQALVNTAQTARGHDASEAMAALGRLAAAAGFAALESVLSNAAAPVTVQREALLAAARFPRQPGMLELILPFTADSALETRWRAVYALTRGVADPRLVEQLERWLRDPAPLVRALAARGLRAATIDSAGRRAEAAAALVRALEDEHAHVRVNVARSLATLRDQAHVPALVKLLSDADGNVALAAAEALGELTLAAVDLRGVIVDANRSIGVRNAALNSLLRVEPNTAIALAREWLQAPAWLHRLYAVRVLAAARNPAVHADLRTASADADARVAAAALQALAADTTNSPFVVFLEKLVHRDPGVRAAALRGLQRRSSPSDLELFLQAYQQAARDTLRVAQLAAIDALGELARKGVPAARSFFLRFRKPDDPLVHQRILDRLGSGDWPAVKPIETGRSSAFYRNVTHRFWHPDSAQVRPRVRISTGPGQIVLELLPHEAPLTVLNFLALAERGYFNHGRWHRVVPNFVLQDGDPRGDGTGGPGFAIRDEINRRRYQQGTVGMALSGPDTGGSQWFITHAPQPHLDGGYTIFGRVAEGMDVAERVVQDDPILKIEVIR
jgi:cyclophilin family peptidyl-prolyl cis-trans isomerase/HEAT repeat protein